MKIYTSWKVKNEKAINTMAKQRLVYNNIVINNCRVSKLSDNAKTKR